MRDPGSAAAFSPWAWSVSTPSSSASSASARPRIGKFAFISFASSQEYSQYRPRPGADAFFVGADEPRLHRAARHARAASLRVAAHEYAHVLIHSGGWTLPEWIAEGIGDVVSTVQIRERDDAASAAICRTAISSAPATAGGCLCRNSSPSPLKRPRPHARTARTMFYAQSWALADLADAVTRVSRGVSRLCSPPSLPACRRSAPCTPTYRHAAGLRSSATSVPVSLAELRCRFPCPRSPSTAPDVPYRKIVTPFDARADAGRPPSGQWRARPCAESAFRELAAEQPASARRS